MAGMSFAGSESHKKWPAEGAATLPAGFPFAHQNLLFPQRSAPLTCSTLQFGFFNVGKTLIYRFLMKTLIRIGLLLMIMLQGATALRASHIVGGDITYSCINNCTVRVHMRAYRDCLGLSTVLNSTMQWVGGVGCTVPPPITPWSAQLTNEVVQLCPAFPTACTTPGATISGREEFYWFRDYDICAVPACQFRLEWSNCCRNGSISSMVNPQTANFYVGATTINTALTTCNNSPQFFDPPMMYIPSGHTTVVSLGAQDPDGDSLAYALGPCRHDSATAVTYALGYSPTAPLGSSWTVSLDPATGNITFGANPGNNVVGVVCVYVTEYRNGVQIGSLVRDFMVTVITSTGNNPAVIGPISNLSTGATVVGNEILMCNAIPLCFDLLTSDVDPGQLLDFSWSRNLVGATFTDLGTMTAVDTVYGNSANPPRGRFCWTPPGDGNYSLRFALHDNFCPTMGNTQRTIVIRVGQQGTPTVTTTVGPCPTMQFSTTGCGTGPFTYQWSGGGGLTGSTASISYSYPLVGTYPWQVIITGPSGIDTVAGNVSVGLDTVSTAFITGDYTLDNCAGRYLDTLVANGFSSPALWSNGSTTATIIIDTPGTYWCYAWTAAGCGFIDTVTVSETLPDIAGYVTTSTNAPLANELVYLIRHDTAAQTLTAIDSVVTDVNGYYLFCNVTDSIVFIKAAPNATNYPNEMPTYADGSLFWSGAISFNPLVQAPINHDFQTLAGINPGGPGFIGGLISQGANKMGAIGDPIVGLRVFLRDRVTHEVLAYRDTDVNGYFSFAGIPLSDYEIVPDKPLVSTTNVPQVLLTAQVPVRDSLNLQLHHYWLELVTNATGVQPAIPVFAVQVMPNPFRNTSRLKLGLPQAAYTQVVVYDAVGRLVELVSSTDLPAGNHAFEFGKELQAGIYFVRVESLGRISTFKVVKE